jgi:hypothetical protein
MQNSQKHVYDNEGSPGQQQGHMVRFFLHRLLLIFRIENLAKNLPTLAVFPKLAKFSLQNSAPTFPLLKLQRQEGISKKC